MSVTKRKAQAVGDNQYTTIISLPKHWVLKQGIEKGDYVCIEEQDDGSLKISKDEK